MSSLAQEESHSISENVTWGQRKRMVDGKAAFISAYNQLVTEKKEIIANAEIIRKTLCVTDALQEEKGQAGGRDGGACGNDAEHRGGECPCRTGPG